MIVLKWLVVLALVGYFGALAVLYVEQRALLFPIPPTARTSPGSVGFSEAEEHILTTADGEKVIVWHVPAKPGHAVVVYFPGNADLLAGRVSRFRGITSDGTGLVALSYRGYAGSSGRPSEAGTAPGRRGGLCLHGCADTALSELSSGVFARQRGCGRAGGRTAGREADLGSPYTSTADVAAAQFRIVPVRWLMKDQFHSDERIARVTAPLLIMHGGRDPAISITFGERLFALAHDPKQFVRFPEGGHDDLDIYGAIETARQFINRAKD